MPRAGWRPTAAALLLLAGAACHDPLAPGREQDEPPPTVDPGDAGWKDTGRPDPNLLALWASPYVVSGGDTLDIYVHSAAPHVLLQVYRLGWYGGVGGRLVASRPGIQGGIQPRCTSPGLAPVACPWRRSTRLAIPSDWVGGIYLLKVRDVAGHIWSYPFVLRSRGPHRFTAVINQFTWQAYNKWNGASFYSFLPASSRYTYPAISFDRPYLDRGGMTAEGGPDEAGGSNDLPAVRWLEKEGFDIGYLSDADLAGAADLTGLHALLFVGHDEYWTWDEFNRVQSLRDAGTHLAFFSGDNADWNIRLGAGPVTGRPAETLICYKYQPDPGAPTADETTTKFRDPPLDRPESELIGEIYQNLLPGGDSPPMEVPPDSLLGPDTRAFTTLAGLAPGDTIAIAAGTEGDQLFPGASFTPPGTEMLLRSVQTVPDASPRFFNSSFYVASSGAGVWATGTNRWAAYLDGDRAPANPKVERLTRVILDWMATH
jgi:N,N-dimethylformamidase beta subunit-like protein